VFKNFVLYFRYLIEFSLQEDKSHEQGINNKTITHTDHIHIMMTTESDDQQLAVTGEEAISEASDVDEPANAEGQYGYALSHDLIYIVMYVRIPVYPIISILY